MNKPFKFNPGFLTDEEAVANFVVRRHQLDTVLSVFESSPGGSTARVLVLAPRGAGKTTLCRRVLAESRGEGRLSQDWHAIFLGEESYVVTTPGEFFLECLFHLRDQTPGAVPEARYQAAVAASTNRGHPVRAAGLCRHTKAAPSDHRRKLPHYPARPDRARRRPSSESTIGRYPVRRLSDVGGAGADR